MQEYEFSRLSRAPAYRLVYDAIETEILGGRLRVGDPLPAEIQLAEQFGVNRSTVREGIRLLEQSGLIERAGGKRPRIAVPHYLDLASSASRALILHSVTFLELWEAAMLIEPIIAQHAARAISDQDILALAANISEMTTLVEGFENGSLSDPDIFVASDRRFHEIIGNASANRVLVLAHEPVVSLFIPAGRIILPRLKTYRRVLDAHRAIFDALDGRDEAKAILWMRRHMDDFRRAYELTGLSLDTPLDAAALGVSGSR